MIDSQMLVAFFHRFLWWADHGVLFYFLTLNSFYAMLLILSIPELWRHWRLADDEHLSRLITSEALPALSLLVPAYNEEVTITASVLSFLTLEYPKFEVILINDGSKDGTMDALLSEFDLYEMPPAYPSVLESQRVRAVYRSRRHSRLIVLDKENAD